MKLLKNFLCNSKNPERDGVLWNMIASMLVAFQSVILLVIMRRTTDMVTAGIYTMGNTLNNMFLAIGKYGMRFYQVSDVNKDFKFRDYRMSRIITTVAMALVSTVYVLIVANKNGYTQSKTVIIIWLCLFKLADAFEDVYYGDYQKNERLDVASKAFALRLIVMIVVFALLIIITKNLLIATVASTVSTILFLCVLLVLTKEYTCENEPYDMKRVWKLLLVTLPLCIGGFLTLYIGAAPRNAIDRLLDDQTQAIYGFIAMPVFVVQLLVMFIFNPMMYSISCLWNDGKINDYLKQCFKQIGFVVVVAIVCIVGAWLLGIPVLSVFYNTDLTPYKTDLMIMMIGSGFLGLAGLMANLLTIMRYQNAILGGYALTSLFALLFSNRFVEKNGMRGAVNIYLILLVILCTIFVMEFIYGVIEARKLNSCN
ncbi:MAG: lipopolysaccharide biosynthesis protein [Eubacterium sp.]|nr:lipopolysaccharide biosynthesis protein [Eubacterium sp.]